MHRTTGVLVTALVLAALPIAGCKQQSASAPHHEAPGIVEKQPGSEISRVTLSESAIKRIALQTDAVKEAKTPRSGVQRVVPYSALIYDAKGGTWIYTSPKPNTFVRHKVDVDYIEGNVAVLKEGPPTGTVVASIGVAELYGTEFKVGH